jgi:NOL1/NOP2/fmu family ribosome biogenesis protein
VFGHNASRAVKKINEGDFKKLAEGEFITYERELANGYIILSMKEKILGLGLLIDGMVRSQIPRKDIRLLTSE